MKTLERIYIDAEEYTASDLAKTNQNILTSEELLICQAYFDGATSERNKTVSEAIELLMIRGFSDCDYNGKIALEILKALRV